jgi:redox-sensing transcriptional repressor
MTERRDARIPEATVTRLPVYRRCLVDLAEQRIATVSSERLADLAGVNAAKVRKDLSYLGSYGTRGVGYEVQYLLYAIEGKLGLTHLSPVVIVGMGNLGQALANYGGFRERGFPVAALVDRDPSKVGTTHAGVRIDDIERLPELVQAHAIAIGIIATPAAAAQDVADRLVAAGVRSILNFAPSVIAVPPDIPIRKVDLATELQILSFYQQQPGRDGSQSAAS